MCKLTVVGYITLFLACTLALFAFFAPIWVQHPTTASSWIKDKADDFVKVFGKTSTEAVYIEGFSGKCNFNHECQWSWANNFAMLKKMPDWHKAAQGLFGVGFILLEVAWFVATFHVCCCLCKHSPISPTLASLSLSAMLLMTASVTVYGIYSNKEQNTTFSGGSKPMFSWAFYGAIGSIVSTLIAAILFFIDGCKHRSYSHQYMGASV